MTNNEINPVPNNDIPQTDFSGHVTINEQQIPCAVLYPFSENPIRVFWQREIVGLLTGNKKGGFDRYFKPQNLQPFVPEKFKNKSFAESTIICRVGVNNRIAHAFEASDL